MSSERALVAEPPPNEGSFKRLQSLYGDPSADAETGEASETVLRTGLPRNFSDKPAASEEDAASPPKPGQFTLGRSLSSQRMLSPCAPPGRKPLLSQNSSALGCSTESSLTSESSFIGRKRAERRPLVLRPVMWPISACTRRSILGDLTLLVGSTWQRAKQVIGEGAHSSHSYPIPAEGKHWGQVHHYWEEGIAVHTDLASNSSDATPEAAALVLEIELFGDAHQFHLRTLGQPLWPGVAFGSTRAEVEAALGEPSLMLEAAKGPSGWAFYRDWRVSGGCVPCRVPGGLMLGLYYEQPDDGKGGGKKEKKEKEEGDGKGNEGGAADTAEKAASSSAAAADDASLRWQLQSARIFLLPPEEPLPPAAAGRESRAGPAQLTPGQSLARLWQGEGPQALRERQYELQSNMLMQAAQLV